MRKLFILLFLILFPTAANAGWIPGTKIGVPDGYPTQMQTIFINTATGMYVLNGVVQPSGIPAPNVWVSDNVCSLGVPTDAIAVDLSGFLIITNGSTSTIPDLAVSFQAHGGPLSSPYAAPSTYVTAYDAQALAIGPTGGARTNFNVLVPVSQCMIDWGWLRGDSNFSTGTTTWPAGTIPSYPTGAAFGLNIAVQFYVEP